MQFIQLLKTDLQSPIFNHSLWSIVKKLISEGHYTIFCTTLYCYLNDYEEKDRVPVHSEGLQVGRPSIVDDSMVDRLRSKVIENFSVV